MIYENDVHLSTHQYTQRQETIANVLQEGIQDVGALLPQHVDSNGFGKLGRSIEPPSHVHLRVLSLDLFAQNDLPRLCMPAVGKLLPQSRQFSPHRLRLGARVMHGFGAGLVELRNALALPLDSLGHGETVVAFFLSSRSLASSWDKRESRSLVTSASCIRSSEMLT